MFYLSILKTFFWDNKLIRNILIIFLISLFLSISYKIWYKNIYNKGYSDAVLSKQKEIDDKYNLVIENIKKENKKHIEIENKKLKESEEEKLKIKKEKELIDIKIKELLKESKSNLINKDCKVSKEEKEIYNSY